jgi:hypothetical protein
MAWRFQSKYQTAQAKSNKHVASASAIDWLLADNLGMELNSGRITNQNLNKQ